MISTHDPIVWIAFSAVIFTMLALDLGVFHRKDSVIGVREAVFWSAVWIALAMFFMCGIFFFIGKDEALLFFTGYIVEKSLSVDNLFVFIFIFSFFSVPKKYEHKILFWGIIGALIMRALLIAVGISLIERFQWITYLLGLFLIFTGVKSALGGEERFEPDKNPIIRFVRRIVPVTGDYESGHFFLRSAGKFAATPLLVVLIAIEITDVVFALDSIPAILAITQDPFLVYSSNLFAILGLRALFFALAGVMGMFEYLKYGVSLVLVVVGVKMLAQRVLHLPPHLFLIMIVVILAGSVILSVVKVRKDRAAQ